MPNLIDTFKDLFTKKKPLPAGMYSYQTPPEEERQYRLHLRVEHDGTGLLIINAATVLHLNQTALEYAYHFIEGIDPETVVNVVSKRYKIDREQVYQDYQYFIDRINTLIETPGLDPVTYLDIERQEPYSADISAPYRLDCALTYQVSDESYKEAAPLDRIDRELTADEWEIIFQKALEQGIPHLLFTGGEPTMREDLPDLILKAEQLGLVTGLLTDGLKLEEDAYRSMLLMNGLDHLMIVFNPDSPAAWEVLEKVLADDIHTTVHLTLKAGENLHSHLQRMAEMGVHAVSLTSASLDLASELEDLRNFAAVLQLDLIWDMPVPYSENNPVSLELEQLGEFEAPEGAGQAWLYVEPDGDVLPSQGLYQQVLGNILTDPWEKIWENR
ncbi:MAG: radical SAM protein [Anaerolineaceae bacterium]